VTSGHALRRIDKERDEDGYWRWRWVCECRGAHSGGRGRGTWNYQSDSAAYVAHVRHADRFRLTTKD